MVAVSEEWGVGVRREGKGEKVDRSKGQNG